MVSSKYEKSEVQVEPGVIIATQNCKRKSLFKFVLRRENKITACFLLPRKWQITVWHLHPISSLWRPLAFLAVTLSVSFIECYLPCETLSIAVCVYLGVFHRISFKCICELERLTCCCFLYRMGNVSLQVWFSFSSSFFFLGLQRKITWLLRSAFVFFAQYELRSHRSEMNLCMKALITNVNWLHYHGMFSYLLRI